MSLRLSDLIPYLLLAVSIGTNVLLGWHVRTRTDVDREQSAADAAIESATDEAQSPKGTRIEALDPAIAEAAPLFAGDMWREFLTPGSSKREFVNRLAKEGMPLHVIRGIAVSQLSYEFNEKKAKARFPDDLPYWERFANGGESKREGVNEVELEFQAAMKDALADVAPMQGQINKRRKRMSYGDISTEAIEQIREIGNAYGMLMDEVSRKPGTMEEKRQKLHELRRAQADELAAALTPDELRQYELRSSDTAMQVMGTFGNLELTEQEYERVFDLTRAREQTTSRDATTGEGPRAPTMSLSEFHGEVVDVLGAERGAQYLFTSDGPYRELHNVLSGAGVEETGIIDRWRMFNDFQQEAAAVGRNPNLTRDQRAASVSQMMRTLDQEFRTTLDEQSYARYEAELRSKWLDRLVLQAVRVDETAAGEAGHP